jgi:zinc/manganese transport system substrate-binding protein
VAQPIRIVAAENFYGDLATQIGGDRVSVVSILSDPNADPHEYESNADDAKNIANAQIVIKNDVGYDAFMDKLMSASPRPSRIVIDVGQIAGRKDGDNPHIWYDPTTMPKVARTLAMTLGQLDPSGKGYYDERLQTFMTSEKAVDDTIASIRARDHGDKVLPTEPVFDYMAEALGLTIVDQGGAFQRAVEDGNDPPASAVATFRGELASHAIKALIYNSQAVTPITTQMQDDAKQNHVPVVPVSETEPTGKTYQQWMLGELTTLQQALAP